MNIKRALSVLVLSVAMLTWAGCALFQGKPPEVRAVNASDAANIGVVAAMKSWNDFIPVGKPSLEVQAHVRRTYNTYQKAQLVLLDSALLYVEKPDPANQLALQKASANASQTLADLVGLLRTIGVKI